MSELQKYYPFPLNPQQEEAMQSLIAFFNQSETQVFILRGHAGTGKTSLVLGLMKHLREQNIIVRLMASTGRAAKVLQAKSGAPASTVHAFIYTLSHKLIDEANQKYKIYFKITHNYDPETALYIVDESSMLSDHRTDSHLEFGSGRLLSDFFSYVGQRKVLFIGDPCQLPPVNTPDSPTLFENEVTQRFQRTVTSCSLTQIMRFKTGSGVFFNFNRYRDIITKHGNCKLQLFTGYPDIAVYSHQSHMIEAYADFIRDQNYHKAIFITHSNKAANTFNRQVRSLLFNNNDGLLCGESLMVVQNNYLLGLSNGDQITIKELSPAVTHRAGLNFRHITLLYGPPDFQIEMKSLMIEDLLFSDDPGLRQDQYIKLMIDFNYRMKEKGIRPDSKEYIEQIMGDPYVNALRVKFGYAVTCHKAQGGEWEHAFIMFENSLNLMDCRSLHRWAYTAITRTVSQLHVWKNQYIV